MSTKPNYFKTGIFVIAGTSLILGAVVVFGAGLFAQNKIYFETYFDESVSGLSVGSSVELRGVNIGRVEKVTFVRDEYNLSVELLHTERFEDYVMVLCSVPGRKLQEASNEERVARLMHMVSDGLRVRLASNLLTGQAYIEADYVDPNRFTPLRIGWQPQHLYIPSAPSVFATLKNSVDDVLLRLREIDIEKLVATAEKLLVSLDKAVDDIDIGGVSKDIRELLAEAQEKMEEIDPNQISEAALKMFASVDKVIADINLPALSHEALSLLAEVRKTNRNLEKLLADPKPQIRHANLPEMVARLNTTLARIDKLITTEKPQIDIILANFRDISENIKELTENLKQHPSELFLSKPPAKPETSK